MLLAMPDIVHGLHAPYRPTVSRARKNKVHTARDLRGDGTCEGDHDPRGNGGAEGA